MGSARDALRSRLTYSNVVATLALFIALGGASYAAIKLPPNSVTKKQIKEDAVRASELAGDSVNGSNIVDGEISGIDIADFSVGDGDLANASVGTAAIANNSIGPDDLADNSIGPDDLADDQGPQSPDVPLDDCAPATPWVKAGTDLDPHFWMDKHQIVHLEGAVKCSVDIAPTAGSTIFHMPFNFRPVQDVIRHGQLGGGLTIAQVAVIGEPFSAGVVYDGGTGATTEQYVSLDGITYRAEGPIP